MRASGERTHGTGGVEGRLHRTSEYWDRVGDLIVSKLDDPAGLSAHGLGPLAADTLDRRGVPVPDLLRRQQHSARIATLTAPVLLERIRVACDGPILLLKGPEVAARYPNRARTFGDLDILVPDARRTQSELVAAGFVQEDDPEGIWVSIHHLARLTSSGMTLPIEIHSVPKWPDGLRPPSNGELFEAAIPSELVAGVLVPAASHHAIILAAHAWAHQPLGRARDLVDVGAFRAGADAAELEQLARAWGLMRPWRTMSAGLDALLAGNATWPLRLWARHIQMLRGPTVLEEHLERILAPFWGYPPRVAARRAASAFACALRPAFDEGWHEKIRRSTTAARRPFAPVAAHRRMLGDSATRGRRRNTPEKPDS